MGRQPAAPRGGRDGNHFAIAHVAVFLAGFLLSGAYSVRLGKENGFDLRNYHYYVVYALFNDRIHFDYAPAQLQSYLNPLSFVPFYLMANHLEPAVTGFLMGGFHGLALGTIFTLSFALFSNQSRRLR